ncbi:MAG: ribonuclease III [Clostridia bacterium]|nr:ribonuclease III [Clostridia bacterium]
MPDDHLNPSLVSASRLAYLGDCVWELSVREMLVRRGARQPSVDALAYVTAKVQSRAAERLLPLLTEEESDEYRRGRNIGHTNIPKSASLAEYRRATGLETLFGWLWLRGDEERIRALFKAAFAGEGDMTSLPASETGEENA